MKMTKILKFEEYKDWEIIAKDFLYEVHNNRLVESEIQDNDFSKVCSEIFNKFGFNVELTLTFGTGVKLMYPIVSKLIENLNLEIKPTFEDTVLLCITVMSIMFLRYKKDPPISAEDIKNKFNPEIQMKFGNPRSIVNKLLQSFHHIYNFIKKLPNLFNVAMSNVLDMFSYTSILLPVMNAIGSFCAKYDLTPDNLLGNLISLGIGITTIAGKQFYNYLINKLKRTHPQIDDDSEILQNVDHFGEDGSDNSKLIQEQ